MATNFPTSLDALTNPTSASSLTSPDHAGQHADANDAIEALQAKVGVNSSAVTTSLDYRVGLIAGRNVLINGAMNVWQRGTTSGTLGVGGGSYVGPDRWWFYNNAFTTTISRQTCGSTLPQFQYCARIQRTSGQTATTASVFISPQETINSVRFAGKNVTLSFYARASSGASRATLMDMSLITGTGIDQSNLGAGAYTGSTQVAYINPTLTTSWQRFSVTGTFASTVTEFCVQIGFIPTGTAGASDYFEITGIQVEEGSVATPFEFEDYQVTLAKCQRYYCKTGTSGSYIANGLAYSTTQGIVRVNFPVSMRVAPSAVSTSSTASHYEMVRIQTAQTACSALPSFNNSNTESAALICTIGAADLTQGAATFLVSIGGNGFLAFSAEL